MKRLIIFGLIALPVLLALACSLTSGVPTEEIRRQAIAILGDEVEEEVVRDFIVVTPPPTFTVTPTPPSCPNPIDFATYNLNVFNDQSGVADNPQFANGLPDGQSSQWEGEADAIRYWSYSLENVISGMITHTLVYTPDDTVTSVDLFVHRERFVPVDDPGWVQVCSGLWSCSFSSEVGSVMYALSASGDVQVDGATIELTNGCEYPDVDAIAVINTPTPSLTLTSTPTATIESSSESPPTAEPDEQPTEAPTDVATPVPPPPTLPLPTPTLPPPSPTLPPPSPTSPPSSPPTDTPVPTPIPVISFSATSYNVAEDGGSVKITVFLSSPSGVSVMVNYATSNGTATAGSDYTASSGTLTFSPNLTSVSFTVPILDDGSVEGDETVILTLSSPVNAVLGTPNPATLIILENDVPTVQFSSATYSVFENAGTATITVTLNVPPVVVATVNYATSNGTATAGSDYTASNGTLTFNPPGETIKTFTVPITPDLLVEGSETIILTLSAAINATLSAPNPATLTIIDDDIFGTSANSGNLLRIDTTTGTGAVIGSMGVGSIPSLAIDPTTGIMYGAGGSGGPFVYTINPNTGAATLLGDSGLGFAAIGAMEFTPGGTLYAAVNVAGDGGTGSDHLATINKTTGVATIIGPFGTCTGVIIPVPIPATGSCDNEGIEGIGFISGTLYGSHSLNGAAGAHGLYTINLATGAATFIAPILDVGGASPNGGVVSLKFIGGILYGGTTQSGPGAGDGGRLVTINPTTGLFTFVGATSATGGTALGGLAAPP